MAKEPEQIELTPQEIEALHERIKNFALTKDDMVLFGKVLHFFVWIQLKLQRSQMTINKLKKIIFGSKTEKSNNSRSNKKEQGSDNNREVTTPTKNNLISKDVIPDTEKPIENLSLSTIACLPNKPKAKGHGRIGADKYTPDVVIPVAHQELRPGDLCPTACGGRLYKLKNPGAVIRVKGQSCAHVTRYVFDKLRCALCGELFTAEAPSDFPSEKYDAHFKAILVAQKYFMATPFYRQERYQKLLGFPLPDSTQWDLVESVADCAYPVLNELEKLAANGKNINNDDTKVKILAVMRDNKLNPDKERKGMFTTCLFAQSGDYTICLYYSGIKHGGENLSKVLEKRDKSLPPIIQMCDALSANVPGTLKTILCNCLTHGRRKFTDVETFFPEECGHVIEQLALIYKYDAEAKQQHMTADKRLAHHQQFSAPIMEALRIWMYEQFDQHKVEPNSALGAAIKYMQKHWEKLTRFVSVSGAHIDNNIVERALKLAIRIRKNAMFYKTLHSAFVGSLFLTLIATCELAGKNPIHYLIVLQEHKSDVFAHPDLWLPWNYESTLTTLDTVLLEAA